jgi:hypothetical protein
MSTATKSKVVKGTILMKTPKGSRKVERVISDLDKSNVVWQGYVSLNNQETTVQKHRNARYWKVVS